MTATPRMTQHDANEQTPLVRGAEEYPAPDSEAAALHEAVYARFSTSRKRAIVCLTALAGTWPSARHILPFADVRVREC